MAGLPAPPITAHITSPLVDRAWGRSGATGGISDEQMDAVLRAVSAWDKGYGFLAADDVGVGKTREAAALVLEAIHRGETRILYTTKNENNVADAMAEFKLVASGKEDGEFPAQFVFVGDYKGVKAGTESLPAPKGPVIYFAHSYNFAAYAEALADVHPTTWIADEAHEYKNQFSARGIAWRGLHEQLLNRNGHFAYFTATPAVTLDELGYLYGLKEWVPGGFSDWVDQKLGHKEGKGQTAADAEAKAEASGADVRAMGDRSEDIANLSELKADDTAIAKGKRRFMRGAPDVFQSKVTPAETEQVMRELKGAGKYIARDLWRGGVKFDVVPVDLLGDTREAYQARTLYDTAAQLSRDISIAARKFGRMNKKVKTAGLDRAMIQSYLKQLLFGLRLPTVLEHAHAALKAGQQVVISLHSVAGDADLEEGLSAEDAETPVNERLRSAINRINTEEVEKEGSGEDAVFVELGEIPEALMARADLMNRLAELPPLVDPVRTIEQSFGAKHVAVITGRRTAKQRKAAMGEFQSGARRVAIISKAGKVGISLHDVNGRERRMLVADYEWSADTFKQELGRVDRTGQRSSPYVSLVASNLAGERKFAATIAARMASLGATSKGSAESTGTDALDQFDVSDGISLTAMRNAVEHMDGEQRSFFTGSKFVELRKVGPEQWEFVPKRAPDEAGMRDFLLEMMMFPIEDSDAVWKAWVDERDKLRTGEEAEVQAARRTGRAKGEVLRRTLLTAPSDPPLTMVELRNEAGERRAVLQGFVTPYISEIQSARGTTEGGISKSRRYVHVTTPTGELVTGLELTAGEARSVKAAFGKGERKTLTPAEAWNDLQAGDDVPVLGPGSEPWVLHVRRDGRLQIRGATLAKHKSELQGFANYETVGNYLYVPNDEAKVLAFLERFRPEPPGAKRPRAKGKGGAGGPGGGPGAVGEDLARYAAHADELQAAEEKLAKAEAAFFHYNGNYDARAGLQAPLGTPQGKKLLDTVVRARMERDALKSGPASGGTAGGAAGAVSESSPTGETGQTLEARVDQAQGETDGYEVTDQGRTALGRESPEEASVALSKAQRGVIRRVTDRVRAAGLPLGSIRERHVALASDIPLVDPVGQMMRTGKEAAIVMTAFRHPSMEIMHAFLKDAEGRVVWHAMLTSGEVGWAAVPDGWAQEIAAAAKATGATSAWFGHNHPSGNVTPSKVDYAITHVLQEDLGQLGVTVDGHVIINHDEASVFTVDTDEQAIDVTRYPIAKRERLARSPWKTAAEAGHPRIGNPREATRYLAGLTDPEAATLMFLDAQNHVVAMRPYLPAAIDGIDRWLGPALKLHGAARVIIALPQYLAHSFAERVGRLQQRGNPNLISYDPSAAWASPITDILGVTHDRAGVPTSTVSYGERGVVSERPPHIPERAKQETTRLFPGQSAAAQLAEARADRAGGSTPDRTATGGRGLAAAGGGGGLRDTGRVGEEAPEGADDSRHPMPEPTGIGIRPPSFRPVELYRKLLELFNPEATGDVARGTAGTIRHEGALRFRAYTQAVAALRELEKHIDKQPRARQVELWDLYERGLPTGDDKVDALNRVFRRVTEERTDELIRLDRLRAERAIANYIGRFWSTENEPGKVKTFLRSLFSKRPFEGPKSFLKQRSLERFVDGLDAGLVPPTYNYVTSQLAKIQEMERLIGAEHKLRAEREAGRAKIVMLGRTPPVDGEGMPWVKVDPAENDPAFLVYGPRSGMVRLPPEAEGAGIEPEDVEVIGPRIIGHWYVPRASSAIWRADLSRGLHGNPVYDALTAPGRALTQLLLGFSGFHGTVIATEGMFSELALAQEGTGVARSLGRAATSPVSGVSLGRRVMAEYRTPGTHPELATVIDAMVTGGFRGTEKSELWTGDRTDALKRAVRQALHGDTALRRAWGASKVPLDTIFAGIELASAPLMSKYVPLMKTAATYRAVAQRLAQLPADVSLDRLHREMSDIVKEMDYRFGQVTYDNHFINNTAKHLAQAMFLAPGWTFGTQILGGRGIRDVGMVPKRIYDRARGKEGARDQPILGRSGKYWVAAVIGTMVLNGILTYLATGERPGQTDEGDGNDGWKDFFAFRDGTYDVDGNANRHTIPGYLMHDVYGWTHHPYDTFINKLSPFWAFAQRAATNRTHFGDLMYDPDASWATKMQQVGRETASEFAPLSVQNYLEGRKREEGGMGELARNAFGVTPAKREFVRTPAQNRMAELSARRGHDAKTPDAAEAATNRASLLSGLRVGADVQSRIERALQSGMTEPELARIMRRAGMLPLMERYKALSIKDALDVFNKATPRERALFTDILEAKIAKVK